MKSSRAKSKAVVLTGAASGLGRALAYEFYKKGYNLALVDIDEVALQVVKHELLSTDQIVSIHLADISREQEVIECHDDIKRIHPNIDMLINNAGISISQLFEIVEMDDFRNLFETNFWGTVYCTRYFLPELKIQDDSRLVNIISGFALMGFPGKTAYGSSKSAIMGFTNALKTELAGTSAKVSMVIPPPLDTGLVSNGKHMDSIKKDKEAVFIKKNSLPIAAVANTIVRRIEKGQFRIVVGTKTFWIDFLTRLFPTRVHAILGQNKDKIDFI